MTELDLDLSAYAAGPRNSVRETQFARDLRALPECERHRVLASLLAHDPVVALTLANRCCRQRPVFEAMLRRCLEEGDLSAPRIYLKYIVPRLGVRRVVGLVRRTMNEFRLGTDSTIYHLGWLRGRSRREREAIGRLAKDALLAGILRFNPDTWAAW
jgi:hypothetical protein